MVRISRVMGPLLVGDPYNIDCRWSLEQWASFRHRLQTIARANLGITGVTIDVWWGLVEREQNNHVWDYYDRAFGIIGEAGLDVAPIMSFHKCVDGERTIDVPWWIWGELAARDPRYSPDDFRYKSEHGVVSDQCVSLYATPLLVEFLKGFMTEFQNHFSRKAGNFCELNISLGTSGELRYPSYDDNRFTYPSRGSLQCYSQPALDSYRNKMIGKHGNHIAGTSFACPPANPDEFFNQRRHLSETFGWDFINWYHHSLIDHGRTVLEQAVLPVFAAENAPFKGIDIGVKLAGVHWGIGYFQGSRLLLLDRLPEITAGVIGCKGRDWHDDSLGRGYRPILSMLGDLNAGSASPIVLHFTAAEMPNGHDGASVYSLAEALSFWVADEARRQGLTVKGENAIEKHLGTRDSWIHMRRALNVPPHNGGYEDISLLRMDTVLDNPVAMEELRATNAWLASMETN